MVNLSNLDLKEENSLKYYYHYEEKYTGKAIWDTNEYSVEQEILKGLFHGNGISYYKTGEKYCEYYYKNGLLEGRFLSFYKTGKIKSKIIYEKGKINGEFISYYENEEIKDYFKYKKNIPNGEFIKKYENGKIFVKGFYKDGKLNGEFISYYENGKLSAEKNYDLGLIKEGSTYNENGIIISTIKTNENKKEEHTFYNDKGIITEIALYKDNKKDGDYTKYDINGKVLETGFYIEDNLFNELTLYNEDGNIIKIENYKKDKLHGKSIFYYENGNIKEERIYSENVLHGSNKFYDINGNLEKEYEYSYGVIVNGNTEDKDEDKDKNNNSVNKVETIEKELKQEEKKFDFANSLGKLLGQSIALRNNFNKYYQDYKFADISFEEGIIKFENKDFETIQFDISIIGSTDKDTKTWLWSWADKNIINLNSNLEDSFILKKYGEENNAFVFKNNYISYDNYTFNEIVNLASGLLSKPSYSLINNESGIELFMLISGTSKDIFNNLSEEGLVDVIKEMMEYTKLNPSFIIYYFLKSQGYQVYYNDKIKIILGKRIDSSIGVSFDNINRLSSIRTGGYQDKGINFNDLNEIFLVDYSEEDNNFIIKLEKLALDGDIKSKFQLAKSYKNGDFSELDPKKAFYWYNEFVKDYSENKLKLESNEDINQNYLDALFELAESYFHENGINQDITKAIKYYKQLEGYQKAEYKLATIYENGLIGNVNINEAIKWYEKAIEHGSIDAYNDLACIYEGGNGTVQDYKKALEYYKKGAEHGIRICQMNIGKMYMRGKGVKVNPEEGVKWYTLAAEQGLPVAQNNLAIAYNDGTGVKKDINKAFYWYEQAAKQGFAIAQFNLGLNYSEIESKFYNAQNSLYWLDQAVKKRFPNACNLLGKFYLLEKIGLKQDYSKALILFDKGANAGDEESLLYIALFYWYGIEVEKNEEKSIEIFEEAISKGDIKAVLFLGDIYFKKNEIEKAEFFYKKAESQSVELSKDYAKLGHLYSGKAFPNDNERALYWYNKSLELGNNEVHCWIKNIKGHSENMSGKDLIELYLNAIKNGDLTAYNDLGILYEEGEKVVKDNQKSIEYYKMGSDKGIGITSYNLGNIYYYGKEVPKDLDLGIKYYKKALDQKFEKAAYQLGYVYEILKDYENSFKYYSIAFKFNDRNSYIKMAFSYRFGDGVEQDDKKAFNFFIIAAEFERESNSSYNARMFLAYSYNDGDGTEINYKKALELFLEVSENDIESFYQIGELYTNTNNKDYDVVKGIYYYKKAAKFGHKNAQLELGNYYYNDKDYKKAAQYYTAAAEQGEEYSQRNLAFMYRNGNGVEKNPVKSAELFILAAKQGNADAQENVGCIYQYALGGFKKNINEAIKWYTLSAEQGYAYSQNKLGNIFMFGIDYPIDIEKAIKWHTEAAYKGNVDSQEQLGMFYRYNSKYQDKDDSYYWFERAEKNDSVLAANMLNNKSFYDIEKVIYNNTSSNSDKSILELAKIGDSNAQLKLACYYQHSIEGLYDEIEAKKWFDKASENGNYIAQYYAAGYIFNNEMKKEEYFKYKEMLKQSVKSKYLPAIDALGSLYLSFDYEDGSNEAGVELLKNNMNRGFLDSFYTLRNYYTYEYGDGGEKKIKEINEEAYKNGYLFDIEYLMENNKNLIEEVWEQIFILLKSNNDLDTFNIKSKVSLTEIDQFEKELGIKLPETIKKTYLIFNTENKIFNDKKILSLNQIYDHYLQIKEKLDNDILLEECMPIILCDNGDYLCIKSDNETMFFLKNGSEILRFVYSNIISFLFEEKVKLEKRDTQD